MIREEAEKYVDKTFPDADVLTRLNLILAFLGGYTHGLLEEIKDEK